MRLPITRNACATARTLLEGGADPDELLEFMRGDTVCLRGSIKAFADRMLKESRAGRLKHVPYKPFNRAILRRRRRPARVLVIE